MTDMDVAEDPKPKAAKEQPTAYSKEFAEEEVTLRGRHFVLREVPIGKFDDIEKKSTDRVPSEDGTGMVEKFDANRRSRLLLAASIHEVDPPLPADGIPALGTRAVVALNTIVNRLHFGDPDKGALETELAQNKSDEEGKKGNG